MIMARSFDGGDQPEHGFTDHEQERRIMRAQKQLSDAARSLYLAHRELEMALRRHLLTEPEVQRRIEEFLSDG
jgi:hypothetical protein